MISVLRKLLTANRTALVLGGNRGAKPALVIDHEVSAPLNADQLPADLGDYQRAWVVLRAQGRPVAIVDAPATTAAVILQATMQMRDDVVRNAAERIERLPTAASLASDDTTPGVTVVICTRDRPNDLTRLLESLLKQTYSDFAVVVVDNAAPDDATRKVVDGYRDRYPRLTYVTEPRPGLSHARNCALRNVDTELVAWIDDDETADEHWIADILGAFHERPHVAAVSGSVLAAELETWPQWWFEQYGGHTKGRGFTADVFDHGLAGEQSPLYPMPPFGVGANMAFRTEVLVSLGGFDVGLGAGTKTFGGEDTLVYSQILLLGHTVVYEPAAVTRHYHRRTPEALERQMYGYGVGLTAYYAALLRWNWRLAWPLAKLMPRALLDAFGGGESAITTGLPADFPSGLVAIKRRGMLMGFTTYFWSRWVNRRLEKSTQ